MYNHRAQAESLSNNESFNKAYIYTSCAVLFGPRGECLPPYEGNFRQVVQ